MTSLSVSTGANPEIFNRPSYFLKEQLGITLWAKQAEILSVLRTQSRVAVRSCNGSGKTFAAACAVVWWLMSFEDSAIAISTAPTERQVRELLWREIRGIHGRNSAKIGGTLTHVGLDFSPNRYARGFSTDSPGRFQGFHNPNILFVVDEASDVHEDIYEAIEGSMTTPGARLLVIGNPNNRHGTFFDAFHSKRSLWHRIHISAFDTPNIRSTKVLPTEHPTPISGLVSQKWVADAERMWGQRHPAYQVRVLGEFPTQAADTLIPLDAVERAVAKPGAPPPNVAVSPNTRQPDIQIGVDVARYGSDSSAICVRNGLEIVELTSHRREDTMQTTGRVVDAIHRHGPRRVFVDEIGVGAGVVDRLREQKLPGVGGVNVSQRANEPDRYANLRAEMYDGLRRMFEAGAIVIPPDQELIEQLAAIRYTFTSSGQLQIESKESMASRRMRSPDKADALALAAAYRRRVHPRRTGENGEPLIQT